MNEMLAIRPTKNKAFIIHMNIVLSHVTQTILTWKIRHYIVYVNDFINTENATPCFILNIII